MTVDEILRTAAHDLRAEVRATTDPAAARAAVVAAARPARRPPWPALAAAVLVVAVVAGVAVAVLRDEAQEVATEVPAPTTAPAGPGPAPGVSEGHPITATPDEGLGDGDTVTVTIEGLEDDPLAHVELALCTGDAMAAAPDPGRCDFPDGGVIAEIEGGRAQADIVVDRILVPSSGEAEVDCAAGPGLCAVGVAVNRGVPEGAPAGEEPLGPQLVGIVGVAFAPVEDREPRLSVSPAEDLRHGQVVTISGEGFVGTVRQAALCTREAGVAPACTGISLTAAPGDGVRTTDGGRFSVEVPIYRSFPSFDGPPSGAVRFDPDTPIVDCLAVTCELTVEGEDGRPSAPVALRFDPDVPPPEVPTFAVSPTSGLRPGDPVRLTVEGLVPGEEVGLDACQLVGGECTAGTSLDPVVADAEGAVDTTIVAVDPASYGVDCTRPGTCAVAIGNGPFLGGNPLLSLVRPVPVQFAPP